MGIKSIISRYIRNKDPISFYRKKGVKIGKGCEILADNPFGSEPYLIQLGDNVRITSGVKFVTHDGGVWVIRHLYPKEKTADIFGRIEVGDNVHIGPNSIIMPNVKIGNNCIIGSGSIVTRNIPDNSVAVGIPAKRIGSIEDYYNKHRSQFHYTHSFSPDQKKEYLCNKLK